jgi:hypothetical protein
MSKTKIWAAGFFSFVMLVALFAYLEPKVRKAWLLRIQERTYGIDDIRVLGVIVADGEMQLRFSTRPGKVFHCTAVGVARRDNEVALVFMKGDWRYATLPPLRGPMRVDAGGGEELSYLTPVLLPDVAGFLVKIDMKDAVRVTIQDDIHGRMLSKQIWPQLEAEDVE